MSDLERAKAYPEGRQFYHSLLRYMQSADFQPQHQISFNDLMQLLTTDVSETQLQELNNISPY